MTFREQASRGIEYLLASQDSDGAWGYRARGMPFVEPTALALAALRQEDGAAAGQEAAAVDRGVSWLLRQQHDDGGWGVCPIDEESTWATGYAVYALSLRRQTEAAGGYGSRDAQEPNPLAPFPRREGGIGRDGGSPLEKGLRWLLRELGPCVAVDSQVLPGEERGNDRTLIGWPWSEGECFWVFPTAVAIVAAVAAGRADSPRVRQGVAYLVDRACQGGGWNFGNPYMLDKALWPAAVETGAALVALRAAGWTGRDEVVAEGLGRLRQLLDAARPPLNLAWGLLGLQSFGEGHAAALARLVEGQAGDGGWRGNPGTTALAILAIGSRRLL